MFAKRARHVTQIKVGPPALEGRRASDRALSFGARVSCHAPASPRALPACACAQESGHRTRSVWGGGAARAFAARARHAARVGFGPPALKGRRAGDRGFSFEARPWCHALAIVLRTAGLRMCARERSPHTLRVGRRRSTHACLARAPRRAGCFWPSGSSRSPRWRQGFVDRCKAVVTRAGLGLTHGRLAHLRKRAANARVLCGEEAQHAHLPRARTTLRELVLVFRL